MNEFVKDIIANYRGSEVGNIYDGKYLITEVDTGTISAMLEKLNGILSKKDVKIIFLVAEEKKWATAVVLSINFTGKALGIPTRRQKC